MWEHLLSGYRDRRIKSWLNGEVYRFARKFLLAQANGQACVNFGCTHLIVGLF